MTDEVLALASPAPSPPEDSLAYEVSLPSVLSDVFRLSPGGHGLLADAADHETCLILGGLGFAVGESRTDGLWCDCGSLAL